MNRDSHDRLRQTARFLEQLRKPLGRLGLVTLQQQVHREWRSVLAVLDREKDEEPPEPAVAGKARGPRRGDATRRFLAGDPS